MHTTEVNRALAEGKTDLPGVLPRLELLANVPHVFDFDIGLSDLPREEGILLVRGPRQYGKSTWLQQHVRRTVATFGPGSAYLLNGDELKNDQDLVDAIRELTGLFSSRARVRRLFIDEITAIRDWQRALKRLVDAGELRDVLVVTTGSKAADLRHASERLPGRKGKLERTSYLFAPISYTEFRAACPDLPAAEAVLAYLMTGGSPVACSEMLNNHRLPDYVIQMTRDWILGEFAASGRSRSALLGVLECIQRFGATPIGQAKLARETGLSNNTVAAGYVELLKDLMCVATCLAWDEARLRPNRRKPAKFPMTNLLAAIAWHPARLRSVADFRALPPEQGKLLEWLVAQELWRRAAIAGEDTPEEMAYWKSKAHEIDFVRSRNDFVEVKRGSCNPIDFGWFQKSFPKGRLTIVCNSVFDTDRLHAITFEEFLSRTAE